MLIEIGLKGIYPVCINPQHVTGAEVRKDERQTTGVRWIFAAGNEVFSSRTFDSVFLAVQSYKDAYEEAKASGYGKMK